jgi:hypothetical protein
MQIDPHAQYTFHTKDQLLAQLNFIVARSQFNQLTMDPTLHAKDVFKWTTGTFPTATNLLLSTLHKVGGCYCPQNKLLFRSKHKVTCLAGLLISVVVPQGDMFVSKHWGGRNWFAYLPMKFIVLKVMIVEPETWTKWLLRGDDSHLAAGITLVVVMTSLLWKKSSYIFSTKSWNKGKGMT